MAPTPRARPVRRAPARTSRPARPRAADEASRIERLLAGLAALYPEATCELDFGTPWQLLVATILSAQCTDVRVNQVTPVLFRRYPDVAAMADAELAELEAIVRPTGFFRTKARHIKACAQKLLAEHGGQVPRSIDALLELPGVARKTANVVLGTAYGIASGVVVDTHVKRLSHRLGLTRHSDPLKIERDLMARVPQSSWVDLSHRLILHGRRVCPARKPRCEQCLLAPDCPRRGVG